MIIGWYAMRLQNFSFASINSVSLVDEVSEWVRRDEQTTTDSYSTKCIKYQYGLVTEQLDHSVAHMRAHTHTHRDLK